MLTEGIRIVWKDKEDHPPVLLEPEVIFMRKLLLLFGCVFALSARLHAQTLADIAARGVLAVGVKADYPPFGERQPDGTVAGMEADMARELAKLLNVRLELVPVLSSNRFDMLRAHKIDLVIATLSITDERRKLAGIIEPAYYASGAGVLYRRELHVEGVHDLDDISLCIVEGNFFSHDLRSQHPRINYIAFPNLDQADAALLDRKCDALFFDDLPLFYRKRSHAERYADISFQALVDIDPVLWGMAIRKESENGDFALFLSKTVLRWHRTGFLLAAEAKWLGENTSLLRALREKWVQRASEK
jgi:polar amino acid transport system substrate-binding protein